MRIASALARILLGLIFFILGLNGFMHFIPAPALSGNVLTFLTVLNTTHYDVLVFGVQLVAGVLLLTNQYVPLALTALAAVLANILTFHLTMQREGLPMPVFVTILWFVVAWSKHSNFAQLLARSTSTKTA